MPRSFLVKKAPASDQLTRTQSTTGSRNPQTSISQSEYINYCWFLAYYKYLIELERRYNDNGIGYSKV